MALAVVHSAGEWVARFGANPPRVVLTVGNFDGVHRGHQRILRRVVERARATETLAAAVTFDPHPLKILRPAEAPRLIATLAQRLDGLERLGLDAVLVLKFDPEVALLPAKEFVRGILLEQLRMAAILVGENFRFGHRQAGDVRLLGELGRAHHFDVEVVPPVVVRGELVSSSAIRRAVDEGRMSRAARLLGRPFALTGEVQRGAGRGTRIVFPTLNLRVEQEVLPAWGVYATETLVVGKLHRSATNVGVRPTFDGGGVAVESHLFDFAETLTSGPLEIRFWRRLRDERKFNGPDALRTQIARDLARTRRFFARLDRWQAQRVVGPESGAPRRPQTRPQTV